MLLSLSSSPHLLFKLLQSNCLSASSQFLPAAPNPTTLHSLGPDACLDFSFFVGGKDWLLRYSYQCRTVASSLAFWFLLLPWCGVAWCTSSRQSVRRESTEQSRAEAEEEEAAAAWRGTASPAPWRTAAVGRWWTGS